MRDNIKGGALTEVTFLILLALYVPKHGYAIRQFIDEETNGRLDLGAGTLYGAINALLEKGWIEPYNFDDVRKKEYIITILGKETVNKEISRLKEVTEIANRITKGGSE